MKVCPKCGKQVDDSFKFCPYCASAFVNVCQNCGKEVPAEFKFCPYCASPIGGVAPQPFAAQQPAQNDDLFDFSSMEAGFDSQLAAQEEYDKKVTLARSYLIRKRFDEARAIYDEMLVNDPMDMNAYMGFVRIESKNYTVLEGPAIDDAIAVAKEIAGAEDLSAFDPQYAGFEDKREKYFKEQEKRKAEEAKRKFLSVADVEGTTLKKYKGAETVVVIPDWITAIGKCAFYNCSSLTSVTIGNGVTGIGEYAFYGCDGLTSITVPDRVTSISDKAFFCCRNLTGVTISDSVKSIGECAFLGCDGLTGITVSENNTAYQSIDGSLYSKDGKTLIQYASGKMATTFTVPDSVTSIGFGAFSNCRRLKSVTISSSVTSIGSYSFEACSSLTSITIPDSVTSIGKGAFYACINLKNVTFKNPNGWWYSSSSAATSDTTISRDLLLDPSKAGSYLVWIYGDYYWKRS